MIVVENVRKSFRDVVAVNDLSFTVKDGDLFAFLGTNGAGKTTTISCMTTLLAMDSGHVSIDGCQVGRDDNAIRQKIGVVFQQSLLDPLLTARENLSLRQVIYGGSKKRIDELIELVDLGRFIDRRYGVLSGGEKRRVDIARSLYHRPTTLFLDEPTTGLDPASRDQVWSAIGQLRKTLGLTVLLTTHYMQETESADYVLIIERGETLAYGTPMALRAQYSTPTLMVAVTGSNRYRIKRSFAKHAPTAVLWEEGGAIHAHLPDSETARHIILDLYACLGDFQFIQGTMDDVFLNLTNRGIES